MPTPPPYEERNHDLVTFEEAISIKQVTPQTYSANVHPHWSFTPNAHGGYLISVVQAVLKLHFATTLKDLEQPDTFSLHYEFLLPVGIGKIEVEIKHLRIGKGTSTVQFFLRQGNGGGERGTGFASNSGPKATKNTITLDTGYIQNPALPPISFSDVLAGTDPNWIRYDVLRTAQANDGALSNLNFAFLRNGPELPPAPDAEKRITQMWISPRKAGQNWTNEMMGILFDAGSPIPENFMSDTLHAAHRMAKRAVENEKEGKSSWEHPQWGVPRFYPTVSLGVQVRRKLPEEGEKWLALRWHTKAVIDGRWDCDIEVWDPKGRLIATGSMVSLMIDIKRRPGHGTKKKESKI